MERDPDDGCRYCEHDRQRGWIFCRSCGARLTPSTLLTIEVAPNGTPASRSSADAVAR